MVALKIRGKADMSLAGKKIVINYLDKIDDDLIHTLLNYPFAILFNQRLRVPCENNKLRMGYHLILLFSLNTFYGQ